MSQLVSVCNGLLFLSLQVLLRAGHWGALFLHHKGRLCLALWYKSSNILLLGIKAVKYIAIIAKVFQYIYMSLLSHCCNDYVHCFQFSLKDWKILKRLCSFQGISNNFGTDRHAKSEKNSTFWSTGAFLMRASTRTIFFPVCKYYPWNCEYYNMFNFLLSHSLIRFSLPKV